MRLPAGPAPSVRFSVAVDSIIRSVVLARGTLSRKPDEILTVSPARTSERTSARIGMNPSKASPQSDQIQTHRLLCFLVNNDCRFPCIDLFVSSWESVTHADLDPCSHLLDSVRPAERDDVEREIQIHDLILMLRHAP